MESSWKLLTPTRSLRQESAPMNPQIREDRAIWRDREQKREQKRVSDLSVELERERGRVSDMSDQEFQALALSKDGNQSSSWTSMSSAVNSPTGGAFPRRTVTVRALMKLGLQPQVYAQAVGGVVVGERGVIVGVTTVRRSPAPGATASNSSILCWSLSTSVSSAAGSHCLIKYCQLSTLHFPRRNG